MADSPVTPSQTPSHAAPPPAAAQPAPTVVDPRAAALAILTGGAAPAEGKAPVVDGKPPGTASAVTPGSPPPTSEAPPPAVAAEEPAPVDEVARQREQLRQGFAKLATEKARLVGVTKENGELKTRIASIEERDAKVKADPAAVLDHFGLTLEQVAAAYLAREQGAEPPALEQKVDALTAELEARKKAEADAKAKADADAAAAADAETWTAGVKATADALATAPDKFPTIIALGEQESTLAVFREYCNTHDVPMEERTVPLLLSVAEQYDKQLTEDLAARVSKVPHIATRATAPATPIPSAGNPTATSATGTSASLASTVVSEAPPPTNGRLTKEQLREMALAHFQRPS